MAGASAHHRRYVPRCQACGYFLSGLSTPGRCPECSREFDLANPHTYTTKEPVVGWRLWLPGCCLGMGAAVMSLALLVSASVSLDATTFIALTLGAGCVWGYRLPAKYFFIALLVIIAPVSIILIVVVTLLMSPVPMYPVSLKFSSFPLLLGFLFGPFCVGTFMGTLLRLILKRTRFSQAPHLPVLLFVTHALIYAA